MNTPVLWSWIQNDAIAPFAFAKQETQQRAWRVSIKYKAVRDLCIQPTSKGARSRGEKSDSGRTRL